VRDRGVILLLVVTIGCLAASSAHAATTTVGQLFAPAAPCPGPSTILQADVAIGTSYTIPAPGVITSWSFEDASPTVPSLKLKVAREVAGTAADYTIVGEALAGSQTANAINTYPTRIPVQTGDLIGFYHGGGAPCGTNTGAPQDIFGETPLDITLGMTGTFAGHNSGKFPVSAVETLQPGVYSISASSGPRTGGTQVNITGHDFTGATSVKFGATEATSFAVSSDTSITAVAPAAAVGADDVTVTTPGGQSPTSTADTFTFLQVCVVPQLKGKTLKKAKRALKTGHCSLGKVTGPHAGRVKHQSKKPGKILAAGSKVSIKLS
jgi:hypothetical protein